MARKAALWPIRVVSLALVVMVMEMGVTLIFGAIV
jgi:hypothetical protein